MKIRMDSKLPHGTGARLTGFYLIKYLLGDALVSFLQFVGDEFVVQQVIDRGGALAFNVHAWAVFKLLQLADQMNASDQPAELLRQVIVVQFRSAAAAAGVHRKAK